MSRARIVAGALAGGLLLAGAALVGIALLMADGLLNYEWEGED